MIGSVAFLVQVDCWAHARRMLSEAVKVHRDPVQIQVLYRIEKQAGKITSRKRYAERPGLAQPARRELLQQRVAQADLLSG